jgi:hypothetical protein
MKRKIFVLIFFFLQAISGCKNKQTVNNTEASLLPVIDIVEGIEDPGSKVFLSEVAENIEFVQLETTDECVIGKSYRLFFSDRYIIVSDWQQNNLLFLFDRTGKYIRKTGDRGQGPGEYLSVSCLDLVGDKLFVWDSDKSTIFCYNLTTGRCMYEKRYSYEELSPAAMKCVKDSTLVFYCPYPSWGTDPVNFFHLHTLSSDFVVETGLHPGKFREPITDDEYYSRIRICTYIKDGNLHFWQNNNNNVILRITDSLQIVPKYRLFLGKYDPGEKIDKRGNNKFEIIDIQESDNFLFITGILDQKYSRHIVYDKTAKKSRNAYFNNKIVSDLDVDWFDYGFHNDIDGSIPFWPEIKGHVFGKTHYRPVSVPHLKKIMNYPYTKSIEIKNREKHQKIKDYIESADEDNNPVVFFVDFK